MTAQEQIIAKYGQPDATYESKYCVLWDIIVDFPELSHVINTAANAPLHRIEINRDFKTKFIVALTNLRAAGLLGEFKTFDGCLQRRQVRGSNTASLHSWAMAMDWNAATNKMQYYHEPNPFQHTDFTKQFVDIMIAAGLFWGGYYSSRFDPMHFSLYNG